MNRKKIRHPKGVKPPVKPQNLQVWDDFPKAGKAHVYERTAPDGSKDQIKVTGQAKNRVLQAHINGPVTCSSQVRIGMFVCELIHEKGLRFRTDEYRADNEHKGGAGLYGVYTLDDSLKLIGGCGMNAYRMNRLRRRYGLSETQARLIVSLHYADWDTA